LGSTRKKKERALEKKMNEWRCGEEEEKKEAGCSGSQFRVFNVIKTTSSDKLQVPDKQQKPIVILEDKSPNS
jgi:hypothetical protein